MIRPGERVRIAVVGCGAAFENLYVRPLRRLAGRGEIEVAGLVDPDEGRRLRAKSRFPTAVVGAEITEVLAKANPGLTLVISPPHWHARHAVEAMEAGSHVLCEKPLADAVVGGLTIVEAAVRLGRRIGVEMPRRYYPNHSTARDIIRQGAVGRIQSYRYREGSVYAWPVGSPSAFDRQVTGGGVLQDKGPHVLDLLEWLFGPGRIIRCNDDAQIGGVESNVALEIRHGEVVGSVLISWDQEFNNGLWVAGTTGEILIPLGPVDFLFRRGAGEPWRRVETPADYAADTRKEGKKVSPTTAYAGIELQIVQALRAVLHGEPMAVPVDEGLRTLELIADAYSQAQPLLHPWLSPEEQEVQRSRHWRTAGTPSPASSSVGASKSN
jgi:predicted dehydrogenase